MFADAIWTHFMYVRDRILVKNPSRTIKGIMNAQDWPSKSVEFDAFYLLVLGEAPIGSQGYSMYSPMVFHQCEWTWLVKGTDLKPGERAANRGDKFRIAQEMKGELLYGIVPGYTEKLTWALNQTSGKFIGTSFNPHESITWDPVRPREKVDMDSGVSYCAGSLRIWDCTDVISS